jgi:hypothetical protein
MDIDKDVVEEFEAVQANRRKTFDEISVFIDAGERGDGVTIARVPEGLVDRFRNLVAGEKELLVKAGVTQEVIDMNYETLDEFVSLASVSRRGRVN